MSLDKARDIAPTPERTRTRLTDSRWCRCIELQPSHFRQLRTPHVNNLRSVVTSCTQELVQREEGALREPARLDTQFSHDSNCRRSRHITGMRRRIALLTNLPQASLSSASLFMQNRKSKKLRPCSRIGHPHPCRHRPSQARCRKPRSPR